MSKISEAAGVAAGGKTGLSSFTTAVLFLVSMLFAPVFTAIPSFATAPALIIVGFLMFTNVTHIKVAPENYGSTIPAYICIISMTVFYSIAEGISLGIISYVLINIVCRVIDLFKKTPATEKSDAGYAEKIKDDGKPENLSPIMYVLAVLFILKYVFL